LSLFKYFLQNYAKAFTFYHSGIQRALLKIYIVVYFHSKIKGLFLPAIVVRNRGGVGVQLGAWERQGEWKEELLFCLER